MGLEVVVVIAGDGVEAEEIVEAAAAAIVVEVEGIVVGTVGVATAAVVEAAFEVVIVAGDAAAVEAAAQGNREGMTPNFENYS